MGAVLFFQLLVCASVIAFNLFVLESNTNYSLMSIVISVYTVVTYAGITFGFCIMSDIVADRLCNIDEIFYRIGWYLVTAKHQRLVLLSIQRAQRPFRFNGFGLINCSLETFTGVN